MAKPQTYTPLRKYRISYFVYVGWFVCLFGFLIIGMAISPDYALPVKLLGVAYFCASAAVTYVAISRFPLVIERVGNTLTTRSLRGTRSVNLADLVAVKSFMFVVTKSGGVFVLKLEDTSGGYGFIQFGSLPKEQRKQLHRLVTDAIKTHPAIVITPTTRRALARGAVIEYRSTS